MGDTHRATPRSACASCLSRCSCFLSMSGEVGTARALLLHACIVFAFHAPNRQSLLSGVDAAFSVCPSLCKACKPSATVTCSESRSMQRHDNLAVDTTRLLPGSLHVAQVPVAKDPTARIWRRSLECFGSLHSCCSPFAYIP